MVDMIIGATYKRRDGSVSSPLRFNEDAYNKHQYPYRDECTIYSMTGRYFVSNPDDHKYDLMEIVTKPELPKKSDSVKQVADALDNIIGIFNTPIMKRKLGSDSLATDAIAEAILARAALQTYIDA